MPAPFAACCRAGRPFGPIGPGASCCSMAAWASLFPSEASSGAVGDQHQARATAQRNIAAKRQRTAMMRHRRCPTTGWTKRAQQVWRPCCPRRSLSPSRTGPLCIARATRSTSTASSRCFAATMMPSLRDSAARACLHCCASQQLHCQMRRLTLTDNCFAAQHGTNFGVLVGEAALSRVPITSVWLVFPALWALIYAIFMCGPLLLVPPLCVHSADLASRRTSSPQCF